MISSPITLIKWIYSVTCTVVLACAAFVTGSAAVAVIWFAVSMTAVTACLLSDDDSILHKISAFILIASPIALVILTGSWWSSIYLTVPAVLLKIGRSGIRVSISVVLAVLSYAWHLKICSPERIDVLKHALLLLGIYLIWALAVYFISFYENKMAELDRAVKLAALDSLNERQLREELAKKKAVDEANARLRERERISRDIHNSVGHTLSAASVTLDAAQLLIDKDTDTASAKMEQANVRVHEAIDSIRGVVRTLDSDDDTVLIPDYIASLKELISGFIMDTDIKVHDNLDNIREEGKIDISTAAFLSSALKELLTNGVKHGDATVFVVILEIGSANILLKVQDNGRGWGDISYEEKRLKLIDGFGLRKLRDHAKSMGGEMEIDGRDGFVVTIDMPRYVREGKDG